QSTDVCHRRYPQSFPTRRSSDLDLSLATVEFRMGDHVKAPAVIEDPRQGRLRYDWRSGDTNVPGTHYAEFVVTFLGGATQRVPKDRKSTRLNSSHVKISYAVLCL